MLFYLYRLLLLELKDFCEEFLEEELSPTNCLSVYSLAHMYNLTKLAPQATDMVRRNFHRVIQQEEFYSLPFYLVRDWLSDKDIMVYSEEVLFEAVVKWVQKNKEEREQYFEELFRLLRLQLISPGYLTTVVRNESLVAAASGIYKFC